MSAPTSVYPPQGFAPGGGGGGGGSSGGLGEIQYSDGAGAFLSEPEFNYDSTTKTVEVIEYDAAGGDPKLYFVSSRGTSGSPAPTQSGDVLGEFRLRGNTATGSLVKQNGCSIVGIANQNWTPSTAGTKMELRVTFTGGLGEAPVMTMLPDGDVLMNSNTKLGANQTNGTNWDVGPINNGNIFIRCEQTGGGAFNWRYYGGGVGSFHQFTDYIGREGGRFVSGASGSRAYLHCASVNNAGEPNLAHTADTDTGLEWKFSDVINVVCGGGTSVQFTTAGANVADPGAGNANLALSGAATTGIRIMTGGCQVLNAGTVRFDSTGAKQTYTPTNVVTNRSFDADTVVLSDLADIVGTLIADLQTLELID